MLKRAITLDPTTAAPYQTLASLMLNTGRPEKAVTYYRAALELGADSPEVLTGLGTAYLRQDQLPQASRVFTRAIRLFPRYAPAYAQRGLVSEKLGDGFSARSAYRRALKLKPNQPLVAAKLALLLTTHPMEAMRDAGLARRVLEPFADQADQSPILLQAQAALAAAEGEDQKAVRRQRRAIELADKAGRPISPSRRRTMTRRLKAYQAGRPYRDPSWKLRRDEGIFMPPQ